MGKLLPVVAIAWLGFLIACAPPPSDAKPTRFPQHVMIIRHAEKTGDPADHYLSKRGQERAEALHKLFEKSADRPEPFPMPDFLFAANNSMESHRPVETLKPLSKRLKLPIDDSFTTKDKVEVAQGIKGLRDALFSDPKYAGKTVLIAWRHSSIPELARLLKAKKAPAKWDDGTYDRVWQITFDDGTATFADRTQRLLPGDSE